MKITDIKAIPLQYYPKINPRDALADIPTRDVLLVYIQTDAGITGIGEGFALGALTTVAHAVENILRPLLIGEDATMIEKLWDKMYHHSYRYGRRGIMICAISAIDMALWDLYGKLLNQPIYRLLGGAKQSVEPYASAGYYMTGKGYEGLAEEAVEYMERGFKYLKMKVGGESLAEDIKRIETVNAAVGDKMEIAIDANSAYDFPTALRMGRVCDEMNLLWFEEPLRCDHLEDSIRLAQAIDTPIAGYETELTRYGLRDFITRHGIDILQIDTIWAGGISECKKLSVLAGTWNKSVVPHNSSSMVAFAANMHLALSNTNTTLFEYTLDENPLRDDLCIDPIRMENGVLKAPAGPGLGVELDPEVVEKYRLK